MVHGIVKILTLSTLTKATEFIFKCPSGENFELTCSKETPCSKINLKQKVISALQEQCPKPKSGSWNNCNAYKYTDNCTVSTPKMKEDGITLPRIKKKADQYFSPACLIHDVCLGTQRYLENGKESCDTDFKMNTLQLCELEAEVAAEKSEKFIKLRKSGCKTAQKAAYVAVVKTKAHFYDIVQEGCLIETDQIREAESLDFDFFEWGLQRLVGRISNKLCAKLYRRPGFGGEALLLESDDEGIGHKILSQKNYEFYARTQSYQINEGCKLWLFYFETTDDWKINPEADGAIENLSQFKQENDQKSMGYKCACQ